MAERARRSGPSSKPRQWREVLRRIHLCIGALLCVPLGVLGLTGSVLVFEDELRAAIEPAPRAVSAGQARPLAEIVAAARAAAPPAYVPTFVAPATELGESAQVRFSDPRRRAGPGGLQIFVDPVSLATLGVRDQGAGIVRTIADLHSNLLARDLGGRSAVGWLGVAMLMLGLSGPFLWWPQGGNWRAVITIRWRAGPYALLRDSHGLVGICGVAVLVVVSASGVYLAFPRALGAAVSSVLPARDLQPGANDLRVTPLAGRSPLDLDAALAVAQAAVPAGVVRLIALPTRPDQPFRAIFVLADARAGSPLVTVFVDPWAGGILELRDPRTYTIAESAVAWQRPLHAGAGLGWPWRGLVFLSGFLPPLLAGSGVTMWLLKRSARTKARAATMARRSVGAAGD